MTAQLSLFLLAFAVSLDSFSVGVTYGLRRMGLPFKSIIIIACFSMFSLVFSMFVGKGLSAVFSPEVMEKVGGGILIFLGGWVLFQFFQQSDEPHNRVGPKVLLDWEIKSLGVVVHILRKPTSADFDRSGSVTGIEAVMLGLALSLDAFGAGVGASLLGYSTIYLAIVVGIMSALLLYAGLKCGNAFSKLSWMKFFSFLPGVLLIVLGIWKM
ncbi:sporulation membrane protein YtaF [Bacillus sp. JZ8]